MTVAPTPEDDGGPHHQDRAALTGQKTFASDVTHLDALHAAFVVSTEPHARLVRVDTERAAAIPGVAAIISGADIGIRLIGNSVCDYPVLAVDRVLFAGQRIAAVAALDVATARRAVEAVDVDYEPLAAMVDIDDVMAEHDIALHPDASSYHGAGDEHPFDNLQGLDALISEDIDAAFAACDEIHEDVFVWDRSHSAPLEPHGCLVDWGPDRVEVWSSTKVPNRLRRQLAELTERPANEFVIHPTNVGGDFGSKAFPYVEAACCFLSGRTGRPVRTTMTYAEMLTSTATRHPGSLRLRTGLREGELHAHETEAVLDGGAFAGVKPRATRTVSILHHALAPYDIGERDERAMTVYTNNVPGGHVRAPGEFQSVFAGESHIDLLARAVGQDPLVYRLHHTSVPETTRILKELQAVVEGWRAACADAVGIGISVFSCSAGRGRSVVSCEATSSGVTLRVGVPDQGSGMYASFRRLAAEVLEIPTAVIDVVGVGADEHLIDSGAGSSRVTAVVGPACIDACERLRHELGEPGTAPLRGYWIADRLTRLGVLSRMTTGEGSNVRGEATSVRPSFGGLAVQVAVDVETGAVDLQRARLVVETGRIVDPVGFRGQLEGGFVYGLGQTLYEHLVVEAGQMVTASLGDYKIACVGDVPDLEITYLRADAADDDRIRAVGELANIGVAPAVANAIQDAVGVRIRELPITAERLWEALRESATARDRCPSPDP